MPVRVVTLNLEQGQKRWEARRSLITEEITRLKPDIIAFNEVSVPLQSARSLRNDAKRNGLEYNLIQQTRVNGLSKVEGEALLTRFAVIECDNFDYQTRDMVALTARVLIGGMPLDIYVTHLYMRAVMIHFGFFRSSNCWRGSRLAMRQPRASSAEISMLGSMRPQLP